MFLDKYTGTGDKGVKTGTVPGKTEMSGHLDSVRNPPPKTSNMGEPEFMTVI